MDEAQRRSEILQAEEAIRLLAEELATAKVAESAAREVQASLQRAVDVVTRAGESVSEAGRTQSELASASGEAVRAAGEDGKQALYSAAEALGACLREVQEANGQFQAAAEGIAGQAERTANVLGGHIEQLNSSVGVLKENVAGVHKQARSIEQKLADVSNSLAATKDVVAEMRQEARRSPADLVAQIRHSLGKRMGIFVYVLILSTLSLVGIGAIIWLLVAMRIGL